MAKSVTFTIDLVVNGKKMVVSATTDAKKFARELGITKTKADELRSSLLNFNQAVLAFQNLGNSLRQVIGIMNDYSSAQHRVPDPLCTPGQQHRVPDPLCTGEPGLSLFYYGNIILAWD